MYELAYDQLIRSIEYTENLQEFNGVAPADFFDTTIGGSLDSGKKRGFFEMKKPADLAI
jgi:hypothetical protein